MEKLYRQRKQMKKLITIELLLGIIDTYVILNNRLKTSHTFSFLRNEALRGLIDRYGHHRAVLPRDQIINTKRKESEVDEGKEQEKQKDTP